MKGEEDADKGYLANAEKIIILLCQITSDTPVTIVMARIPRNKRNKRSCLIKVMNSCCMGPYPFTNHPHRIFFCLLPPCPLRFLLSASFSLPPRTLPWPLPPHLYRREGLGLRDLLLGVLNSQYLTFSTSFIVAGSFQGTTSHRAWKGRYVYGDWPGVQVAIQEELPSVLFTGLISYWIGQVSEGNTFNMRCRESRSIHDNFWDIP